MDENKAALVKKIGEGNKSLSVIVAEDKLAKFKRFSQGLSLSMGWLLNQAIDRYLEFNSVDIFKTTIGDRDSTSKIASLGTPGIDTEELIKTSIENYLLNTTIGKAELSPVSLSTDSIDEMVKASIEKQISDVSGFLPIETVEQMAIGAIDKHLEELSITSIGREKGLIEESIAPLTQLVEGLKEELGEVSEFARNLQGEIVKVKKPLAVV
jgi:hypothetical protein